MKVFLSAICGFILCTLVLANPAFVQHRTSLLGAKECTWGPSYWCSSLQNAKGCNAVTHCIKSVWEKQRVPQDNDSICKICKDMVKQARDQLESNETQEELRDVFEGSCKLIHIKPIVKECCKLADDFIPELVETLASQMNPDMVCSVAGLCNNARIDEMLAAQPQIEDIADTSMSDEDNHEDDFNCEKCNKISTLLSAKFQMTERDSVLENMLMMCGRLSSYSDSCSNLVLLNFNEIYGHLEEAITPDNICHMSGACSSKYHQHQERLVEINTKSDVGFVDKDDIPCELCEQLVRHLRDLLIANTTESEFKSVLQGLCNQTKGFKKECLTIVDEYYDVIYKSLVTNLDDQGMCFMIGVCPKGLQDKKTFVPIMPKLPVNKLEVSITEKPKRKLLGANEPKFSMAEIQSFQLPIDQSPLLLPGQFVGNLEGNTQSCSLCEYILHFIQEDLSLPKTSDKLKTYVEKLCHKLPSPIREDCDDFVTTYGDAVIALLVQGIDPRECCPKMNLCPKPARIQVTIITESKPSDKPQCPLCLLAVTNAQNQIQSDKSKTHIKKILKNLCKHAKSNLRVECEDFVDTYTSQLLDLLARDFSAQQICTELKCCVDNKEQEFERHVYDTISDESNSNEIFDNTVNGQVIPLDGPSEYEDTPNCMLCKFLITQVERKLHKKSDKEIDDALNHVCDKMHKVQSKCRRFIDKHREQIKRMIKKQMLPKQICHALGMCLRSEETLEEIEAYIDLKDDTKVNDYPPIENQQCTLCQIMVTQVEQELKNKKTRAEIQHALEHACSLVPPKTRSKCDEFIEQYTDLIINLLDTVPPKEVCKRLGFCNDQLQVELFDVHRQLMTEDLTDCAVCNSAAKSLKDLQEWMTDDDEILSEGCSRLPGKHHDKCHSLVVPYGISLLNLIRRGELDTACSQIGMCYRNQYLTLADLD